MTDKQNGSSGSEPATVEDFPMPFNLPCVATTSTTTGGNCSLATSAKPVPSKDC